MRDPFATYPPQLRAYLEEHRDELAHERPPYYGPPVPWTLRYPSRHPEPFRDRDLGAPWTCRKCQNLNDPRRAGCAKCGSSNHGYRPSALPLRPW